MLYVTTRNTSDAYTAHRALNNNFAPDGGLYVPFRIPSYTPDELAAFGNQTCNQTIAGILNQFFSAGLDGWTIDLLVGRNLTKLVSLNQKICIAEVWHNSSGTLDYFVNNLYHHITSTNNVPTDWFKIASRIAMIFGVYSDMLRNDLASASQRFDISLRADDPYMTIAALYAKQMGLPVATMIFSCGENSPIWDIMYRGQCNCMGAQTAKADKMIAIEHLLSCLLGTNAVKLLLSAVEKQSIYTVDDDSKAVLQKGYFTAAISEMRLQSVTNSVKRTDNYQINAAAAYSIGGLQDYRASTGESRLALLFAEESC